MENEKQLNFGKIRFWIIFILILIGIGMCIELGYIFYKTNWQETFAPSFCAVSEIVDCDGVALTPYALSMGVPNALWGLILYLVMLMLLFVDRIQAKFKNTIFDVFENPRSYIAFLGVLSFAISMVLAFISIFEINKICVLCFCTYFINLFIAITACTSKFFIKDILVTAIDFVKGAKKYFALFLIVSTAFVSTLWYLNDSVAFSPKLKQQKQQKEFYDMKSPNKYAIKGNILGDEKAKVIINVYSDYNCPFCKVVNTMLHKVAKEKKILVNEINFPIDNTCNQYIGNTMNGHESSCLYARYALAAKKQCAFWDIANILFNNLGKDPYNDKTIVKEIKNLRIKIDTDKFLKDTHSSEILEEVKADVEKTMSKSITATPTIEINGVIYVGAMPYDKLIERIDLAQKRTEN